MIRILLVDDHSIMREGLRLILARESDFDVVGEASSGDEAIRKAEQLSPDVIVLDIRMPKLNGLEAARHIHKVLPECAILFLTVFATDNELFRAIKSGARGFLVKTVNSRQLVDAIRRVNSGEAVFPPHL